MTTITATVNGQIDNALPVGDYASYVAYQTETSTVFSVQDVGNVALVFDGSGFDTYSGLFPTVGTITGLTEISLDGGVVTTATWTGLSLDAGDFFTWVQNNDMAAFELAAFGGNDTFAGGTGGDLISGFGGDDVISPNGGGDVVSGGDGDDTVNVQNDYGVGANFDGGANTLGDTIAIVGGTLQAGIKRVDLHAATLANFEAVTFAAGANAALMFNYGHIGAGLDTATTVTGSASQDTLGFTVSGTGTYDLSALSGFFFSNWTDGTDLTNLTAISAGNYTLNGDDTSNSLIAGAGNDTLFGNGGNDILNAGNAGNDSVDGGAGNDVIIANGGSALDVYDGGADIDTLQATGATADFHLASILNIEGLSFAKATGSETALNAIFQGSQLGTTGVSGSWAITGSSAADTVTIQNIAGTATFAGWSFSTWSSVSDTIALYGDSGDNSLTGTLQHDRLDGGAGADTLRGGAGDDQFYAGPGGSADGATDNMYGGAGNDSFGVFEAGDIVHENAGQGTMDRVAVWIDNYTLTANVERMDLYGVAVTARGNALGNGITGNDLNNTLYGMGGVDALSGGLGSDTLVGGAASDQLIGGAGNDTASYATSLTGVNVNLTTGAASGGDAAGDTFSSIENLIGSSKNDTLTGNAGGNNLNGGNGADTLSGAGGADVLIGGSGHDIMTGGAGGDKFVFNVAPAGVNSDTITDFTHASDKIQFDNLIFTALGADAATLGAAKFYAGVSAHDVDDRIIYDAASGKLYYDDDGNGVHVKVLVATLDANLTLTNADFGVI